MGLSGWPTLVDDDGSLTLGTEIEKSIFDSIKTSIEADLFSTTNPAVTCENIIDEVVPARGSKASLDARLDVALNEDGTLKSQASLVTSSDAQTLQPANWVTNDNFLIWAAGVSAAPTGYTLAGTGAACARSGTGLGDTTTKVGDFCAKLTYGSSTLSLTQTVIATAAWALAAVFKGDKFGIGAWVKSAVASQCRLKADDGVTTSYSDYHTGDGTWQWLSFVHTTSGTGTKLDVALVVESSAGNPAYLSGLTVMKSNFAPPDWFPCRTSYGTVYFPSVGGQSTGTFKSYYTFQRPAIVKDIICCLATAPTGATTFKIDVNNATNSMLSSVIAFTASDKVAGKSPDGTYQYRCFDGARITSGTTISNSLNYDIDAVGNTIAGSDLIVMIRALVYVSPLESLMAV